MRGLNRKHIKHLSDRPNLKVRDHWEQLDVDERIKLGIGEIVVICTNNQQPSPLDINLCLCFYMIYIYAKMDIWRRTLLIIGIVIIFSGVLQFEGRGYFIMLRCI
jgi:hypothetical protein